MTHRRLHPWLVVTAVLLGACGGADDQAAGSPSPAPENRATASPSPAPQAGATASPAPATAAPVATPRPTAARPTPTPPAPAQTGYTAADREAHSALRNTLTAAKTIYTDNEDYRDVTPEKLKQAEPSYDFVEDGASTRATLVSVKAVSHDEFRAAARSSSGTCFLIRDSVGSEAAQPGVTYAELRGGTCKATAQASYKQEGW